MRSGGTILLLGWVLASPFAVATAIGASGRGRRLVARLYPSTIVLGWIGVALLVGGALVLSSPAAMLVGAPLAGLAVWSRGGGGDDGGGGGGGGGGDDPPPGDGPERPGVDWEAFERAFRDYARRNPPSPRPRREPAHRGRRSGGPAPRAGGPGGRREGVNGDP